jgi:hypothetical protein
VISYTTTALVLSMLASVNAKPAEAALLDGIVAAVSRQIDQSYNQIFAGQTYTNTVLRAQIDPDGILQCWPACPTMSAPTAIAWKRASDVAWNDISGASIEVEQSNSGCQVRVLNPNLGLYRGARVQMRLTFTGGWATLGDVPSDFELGVRRACVIEYKKRDLADMGKTAIPALGVVTTPSAWPADLKRVFESYRRVVLI